MLAFAMFRFWIVPLLSSAFMAQAQRQISLESVLDKTEATSSLTANGSPFHAEMMVTGAKNELQYKASVIVDWSSSVSYRVEVRSIKFHEVQTVDGGQVQEQSEGDFYPGWLHAFVTALLDPIFVKPLFVAPNASIGASQRSNGSTTKLCIDRNDRPGGIRDDMTWSGICVTDDGLLLHDHNFALWIDYSDHQSFGEKKIARSYSTTTGSYEEIVGKLTSLRALNSAEASAIRVTAATPSNERIGFALISTTDEEARTESIKPFQWPSVREGKTDGYMIVRALTDVTGQVRETSKYNSDNAGLEEAGRQAALGYKFEPMLVKGIPVEMEMPLVLHFVSKIEDPLTVLSGAELLKQIKGCKTKLVPDLTSGPNAVPTRISVNEEGKLTGEGHGPQVNPGNPALVVTIPASTGSGLPSGIRDCKFAPLEKNGVATYYHGDLLVVHNK